MSNNKQSSVEWLISQLTEVERKNWINNKILCISKNSLAKQTFDAICEQAKEKHGNEVRDAFYIGRYEYNNFDSNSTQYYNETYGGNNEQQ